MRFLKIAWDNTFASRNETGSGVYASRLLGALKNRDDLNLRIVEGPARQASPHSALSRALRTGTNMAWIHARLPDHLAFGRFDMLHSPAYVAPISSPCPVAITIHDISYLLYPGHFAGRWIGYMNAVMPRVVEKAAAILCGSESAKRDIVRAYKICDAKVHVTPYGVDHSRFRPAAVLEQQWARASGIREGYVLHVGVFSRRKNVPALLRAIAELRAKGHWTARQLVLAGPESPGITGATEIRDMILELELSDLVVLPGRVPDEHLPGLYSQASLMVTPSLYEGFGFPVLEAMAAGTPVVASNTSSLPEICGEAAVLVDPRDQAALASAMDEVLRSRKLAEELRSRGLAQAARFSWSRTADETVRVYRAIGSS